MASTSHTSQCNTGKEELGWIDWLRGMSILVYEILFQKFFARNLTNRLVLPSLVDVTCIVTGSTSGIGLEIAKQLAMSGAHVIMAVRNQVAAQELITKWRNETTNLTGLLNIEVMQLDLLSLKSVVEFADAWNSRSKPLHVLINNAGIFSMGKPQMFSEDGYEAHMQVNHLAPTLLSIMLLPSLFRGSPSRIINVNSLAHFVGFVDPEDMNFVSGKRKFTSFRAYSSSKLAQVMCSSILQKKLTAETGISVACVCPGGVRTNVARDLPTLVQFAYKSMPSFLFTAQEGARSALFAATDPQIPKHCNEMQVKEWPVCTYISPGCRFVDVCKEAHNTGTANRVWEKTLALVGIPSDAVEQLLNGDKIQIQFRNN